MGSTSLPVQGTPMVSVIMPVYNCALYIREALESIFAQTFSSFEVITINDGSSDTEQLERELQPYLDRIVYLEQENRGPSVARNLGIRHARGEFIAFLDSDDCWLPNYLSEQMKLFKERKAFGLLRAMTMMNFCRTTLKFFSGRLKRKILSLFTVRPWP